MAIATDRPDIFISYAHADSARVLPTVRAMQAAGIDLWYDEGIEAGSEWPEYIAEKVMNCSKFLLFISNAYLASQNCKRELNFAISRKKDILSVHLEAVQLSPGMEMQLGTYQAIFRSRFADDAAFHRALTQEHFFDNCIPGGRRTANPVNPMPTNPVNRPPVSPAPPAYQPQGQGYAQPQQQPYRPQPPVQPVQPAYQPQPPAYNPYAAALPIKNRIVAACLALFLGSIGAHCFYLGKKAMGIVRIVLLFTGVGTPVSVYWGIIDAIILFATNDRKFEQKYKCRTK